MYILWVQSILGTLHVGSNTVARSVTRGNTVGGADWKDQHGKHNQDITGFRVQISLASACRSIGQPISNLMNINRDVN